MLLPGTFLPTFLPHMPDRRPILTTHITRQERQQTRQELDHRAEERRGAIDAWLEQKRANHIDAGLYRKTIKNTTYIYKPLGDHLWERTSEDGTRRTLVKHLPDNLD